jgi:hypothetical protein
MKNLPIEQLDEYSCFAVNHILKGFPELDSHLTIDQPEGYAKPYAVFELPCPSPTVKQGLWVATFDMEITVGFHTHHSHFNDFDDVFNVKPINDALEYIDEIISERIVVISWYQSDSFSMSSTIEIPYDTPPKFYKGDTHITCHSWLGTYNTVWYNQ